MLDPQCRRKREINLRSCEEPQEPTYIPYILTSCPLKQRKPRPQATSQSISRSLLPPYAVQCSGRRTSLVRSLSHVRSALMYEVETGPFIDSDRQLGRPENSDHNLASPVRETSLYLTGLHPRVEVPNEPNNCPTITDIIRGSLHYHGGERRIRVQ
jgi:hypothetical protein